MIILTFLNSNMLFMQSRDNKYNINHFGGFLICLCLSALTWFIVKLSDDYTINLQLQIRFTDAPANQIIHTKGYPIDVTIQAEGFKLLKYKLFSNKSRRFDVPLSEVKYKNINESNYSISSTTVKDLISNYLQINISNIELTQTEYLFTMYKLASKRVKVSLLTDISFNSQYNLYGEPSVTPDSITIYGAYNSLKDYDYINTQLVARKNVKNDINTSVPIQLNEEIFSDTKKVDVYINVEKYTESEVTLPINTLGINNLILFPDKAKVKYIVALKDYSNISTMSFNVEIDTTNFRTKDLLPIRVAVYPNNTTIIGIEPEKVEYLMTK